MGKRITYSVRILPPTYRCVVCGKRFYGSEGAAVCDNCGAIVCIDCTNHKRFHEHACNIMASSEKGGPA